MCGTDPGDADRSFYPLPLWERVASAGGVSRVRGRALNGRGTPHPPSMLCISGTLSRKGRG